MTSSNVGVWLKGAAQLYTSRAGFSRAQPSSGTATWTPTANSTGQSVEQLCTWTQHRSVEIKLDQPSTWREMVNHTLWCRSTPEFEKEQ